jgi:CHAT domain-containing protein
MHSLLKDFFQSPGVFLRYRLLKTCPELLDEDVLKILKNQQWQMLVQADYRQVQALSEKIHLLQNCMTNGVETTLFGAGHQITPDMIEHIPDFYSRSLHTVENNEKPLTSGEKIQLLNTLLKTLSRSEYPLLWAELHQKLCAAHLTNRSEQAVKNSQNAIRRCESALEEYRRDLVPVEWARIQSYLGIAWKNAPQTSNVSNIEKSIHYYSLALEGYPADTHPLNHAVTLMNLAIAFSNRTLGDQTENIENSVQLYHRSLDVFTDSNYPVYRAKTHLNLSTVYTKRTHGSRTENLDSAVKHLQQSLDIFSRNTFPNEWAMAQTNLGNAFLELGRQQKIGVSDTENKLIESAIRHYKHALKIRTKESSPAGWAKVNANLSTAYNDRSTGSRNENSKAVLRYCQNALSVFTSETAPIEWANINKNLALAMVNQSDDTNESDQQKALEHLKAALSIFTPENFPRQRLEILVAVLEIYMEQSRWDAATQLFDEIRRIDDTLRKLDITLSSKSQRVRITGMLYGRAAWCLAKCGRLETSLEWLETGKMQLFKDRVSHDKNVFDRLKQNDRDDYVTLTETIRKLTSEQHSDQLSRPITGIADDVRHTCAALDDLTDSIRRYEPSFLSSGIRFDQMTRLLPNSGDTAFIIFNVTRYGSFCLILSGSKQSPRMHTIFIDSFTYENLKSFAKHFLRLTSDLNEFRQHTLPPIAELRDYYQTQLDKHLRWNRDMQSLIDDLSRNLLNDAINYLKTIDVSRIVLVTHRELNILPLHIARDMTSPEKPFLLDSYEISYLPAFTLFRNSEQKKIPSSGKSFLGICDLHSDLPWAQSEIEAVSTLFENKLCLDSSHSLPDAVISAAPDYDILHFCCHAMFDTGDPYRSRLTFTRPDSPDNRRSDNAANTIRTETAWTLSDILRDLHLPKTELVVLSACESGITESALLPDECIGLPAGFLLAGAQSILSSLWCVPDKSAYFLMNEFYRNLVQKNMAPARALRDAQQSLKNRPGHSGPMCWGAFKLVGI